MKLRHKPNQKGFTMIELMVVVVIVAILAAIAIPIYGKYIKNARMSEAEGRIGEIITAAKAYAQEYDVNDDGSGDWPVVPAGGELGIVDLTSDPLSLFDYSLQGNGGGESQTDPLVVIADGKNKMNGAQLIVTVPNINLNGTITTKTLP